MITEIPGTKALFASFDQAVLQLVQLFSSFSEDAINARPSVNCWSAGQVAEHLTKSNVFIAQALTQKGKTTVREPDERVPELKAMFLDFSTKFKSPVFIIPTQENYNKETLVKHFENSAAQVRQAGKTVNLSETITDPALGEITKLEVINFVIFHSQRHIYQLKKIAEAVKNL